MWQEGEMSLGEPGGWCVSTHVNNLLLPCAGGSNERQERSVREDAAGWKRSAAGLARQPRWERKKKRENESREDAKAVVILPFSVRLLWGSVESKKRSRLVVHTTHNRRYRRKKKMCFCSDPLNFYESNNYRFTPLWICSFLTREFLILHSLTHFCENYYENNSFCHWQSP